MIKPLTLSSTLPLSKCICLCIVLLWAKFAQAQPNWQLEGYVLPSKELQQLQKSFPSINNAKDLQQLLIELSHRLTLEKLEAWKRGDVWILKSKPALGIKNINISTNTRHLRSNLSGIARKYIGRVHSAEVVLRLRKELKNFLAHRGFREAEVDISIAKSHGDVAYVIKVSKGAPCRIDAVKMPFLLPEQVKTASLVGELCDAYLINDWIASLRKELRSNGFVEAFVALGKISYRGIDSVEVEIEGKLGKKIRYEFIDGKGNRVPHYTLDDLGLDAAVLGHEALIVHLVKKLRYRGYIQAVVRQHDIIDSDTETRYIYTLERGEKFSLKDIDLQGIEAITTDQALDILNVKVYDRDKIEDGITRLKSFYMDRGFWQVHTYEPIFQHDLRAKSASMLLRIEEGKKLLFAGLNVEGSQFFSAQQVKNWFTFEGDTPLIRQDLIDFEQIIISKYQRNGFMHVDVKTHIELLDVDEKISRAFIKIKIRENKRMRIGSINIVGLRKTKRNVVERELRFAQGEWYDRDKIIASDRALEALGLFSTVEIRPVIAHSEHQQLDYVNFNVHVQESEHGYVSFGPGYSLQRGLRYSGEIGHNNLWGTHRRISLFASVSEDRRQLQVKDSSLLGSYLRFSYYEPQIFGLPLLGVLSFAHKSEADYYHSFRQSFNSTLIYPLASYAKVSLFYEQSANRIDGRFEQEYSLVSVDDIRIGEVGLRLSYDSRNNFTWATRGMLFELGLSWARSFFISDVEYFKMQVTNNLFFSFYHELVLALSFAHTSFMQVRNSSSNDILHASERLQIGGANTVRGFANQHNLGPYVRYFVRDNETFISEVTGGTQRSLIKVELRYQIVRDFLALSTFLDSGNTYFSEQEAKRYQEFLDVASEKSQRPRSVLYDNFAYEMQDIIRKPRTLLDKHYLASGLALNYLSPIGLVNFAYGYPLRQPKTAYCNAGRHHCFDRRAKDPEWYKRGRLHFNVGAKF